MRLWQWLVVIVSLAAVVGLYLSSTTVPHRRVATLPVSSTQALGEELIVTPAPASTRYFFDVHDHSAEEIKAVLLRAKDTYDNLPAELREGLTIAMVLHGPDVQFFADDNYAENKALVDLAASLDAFGFVDLKMCAVSVRRRGLQSATFPSFIEMVAYGPEEIARLEAESYIRL